MYIYIYIQAYNVYIICIYVYIYVYLLYYIVLYYSLYRIEDLPAARPRGGPWALPIYMYYVNFPSDDLAKDGFCRITGKSKRFCHMWQPFAG